MNKQLSAMMFAMFALSVTHADEAQAQFQSVDPKALPAVKSYTHRRKIDIVDENPEITNTMRNPEPRKILLIGTPAQQAQQIQYMVAPSAGGPGLPPGAIDISGPPPSGFVSNMPTNPNAFSKRNSLPSGMTSNGLNNQNMVSGHMHNPKSIGPQGLKPASTPSSIAKSQPVLVYQPYNNGSGTSGGSNTKTTSSVSGKLERGSLMNKTQK